jgi:hypothetical protein
VPMIEEDPDIEVPTGDDSGAPAAGAEPVADDEAAGEAEPEAWSEGEDVEAFVPESVDEPDAAHQPGEADGERSDPERSDAEQSDAEQPDAGPADAPEQSVSESGGEQADAPEHSVSESGEEPASEPADGSHAAEAASDGSIDATSTGADDETPDHDGDHS